jgi:hypothetical protein
MIQSVGGKDINTEAEVFMVLTAVTKQRPVKRLRNLVRAIVNRRVCELVKRLQLLQFRLMCAVNPINNPNPCLQSLKWVTIFFFILYVSFFLVVIYIRRKALEYTQFTLAQNVNAIFYFIKSVRNPALHQAIFK